MAARNPLQSLFAGGQLPEESVPVAMARAVVGVPHDIETDVEEEDHKILYISLDVVDMLTINHVDITSADSKKRLRAETATNIISRKRSQEVKDRKNVQVNTH